MKYLVVLTLLLTGCAAKHPYRPVPARPPIAGREHFVAKVWFKTGEVNIKESTVRIEPVIGPSVFLATWFEGDLKRVPVEKQLVQCDVIDFQAEGGSYTKLSCPEIGDLFIKTVIF